MPVPTLPTPPNRSQDQATFDTNIAAWIAAIDAWTTAVNAMGITTITGSIQNTQIGNVTPSTGAFTTLSASKAAAGDVFTWGAGSSKTGYLYTDATYIGVMDIGGAGNGNGFLISSSIFVQIGGATKAQVSSTGLAVTGTISGTSTIGVGGATPAASGAGITFPATQSASSNANTLDDYEEGTFDPIYYGTTVPGVTTYTEQTGRYTKIGNRVDFSLTVAWSNATGTGSMQLGGLPFAAENANSTAAIVTYNLAYPAGSIPLPRLGYGTAIDILQIDTGGSGSGVGVAIDTSGIINISGSYFV